MTSPEVSEPEVPKRPKPGADVTEDEKLGTAIQRFVQTQSFNAFERMIASYIVQAITGDPLQGIIFVCRAALTLDEERCQLLSIDFQEVVDLYTIAERLNTATLWGGDDKKYNVNFKEWEYKQLVAPWIGKVKWYPFDYSWSEEEEILKWMDDATKRTAFYHCCRRLTEGGYKHMVSDFLLYAMPKSQGITRKLSELVSPSTFHEIFATVRGVDTVKVKPKRA